MSKLLEYLNTLDRDSAARDSHNRDPAAAMTAFGLSADDQAVLMSGNLSSIAAQAGIAEQDFPRIQVDNIDLTY